MKKFEAKKTGASAIVTWSVLNFFMQCCAAGTLVGIVRNNTSYDRYLLYVAAFDLISVFVGTLFGLLADMTTDKSIGIRLGVLLASLGFVWPYDWGITPKVVLLGLGVGMAEVWLLSAVLKKGGRHYDVGAFLASGAVGIGAGRYMPVLCFFAVCFMMIIAALSPKDADASFDLQKKDHGKKLLFGIAVLAVTSFASFFLAYCLGNIDLDPSFGWVYNGKTFLVCALALAVGLFAGDLVSKKLGGGVAAVCSLGGGYALFLMSYGSKVMCLGCLALFGMILPVVFSAAAKYLPDYVGFACGLISSSAMLGILTARYVETGVSSALTVGALAFSALVFVALDVYELLKKRSEKR